MGFLSFHIIPLFHASSKLGRITAMCIKSTRQREGIGRALLTRLDEIASRCGCVRIEVTSGDHRAEDAHLFYQACGYAVDSRRFQKILPYVQTCPEVNQPENRWTMPVLRGIGGHLVDPATVSVEADAVESRFPQD